jgi:hypothetical protein
MLRHCKSFCLVLAVATGFVGLAPHTPARAYDEQASLDAALGYALVVDDAAIAQGPSLDFGASLGLSDAIVARAALGYALAVGGRGARASTRAEQRETSSLGRLRVEAVYLLDVLQVVPFFGLGASITNNPDGTGTSESDPAQLPVRLGGHLVFGLDYLLSRSWIVGLDVRSALLFAGAGERLSGTDVALRVSRMFETF